MTKFKLFINLLVPILLVTGLAFTSCENETTNPTNTDTFSARIVDAQNVGVGNANVEALNSSDRKLLNSTITDEDGNFTLKNLPTSLQSVILKITHTDFVPFEQNLETVSSNTKKGTLPLILNNNDTCCGKIIINVKKQSSDDVLKDVEIKLSRGSSIIRKAKTDEHGQLIFEHICEGEYWLRLYKDGYKVIEEDFNLEECDTLTLDFEMETKYNESDTCCHGSITILPKDKETGNIINSGYVKLWKDGSLKSTKQMNGEAITFEELCEGKYGISIISEHYKSIEFHVELDCNQEFEAVKYLESSSTQDTCCDGKVIIIPKNNSDDVLNGAQVKLRMNGKQVAYKTVENGYAKFTDLCEGTYEVVILKDHYQAIEFSFELDCNEEKEIVKNLEDSANQDTCCNGKIKVTPKDKSTGKVINGAIVKLWKGGTLVASKTVEGDYAIFEELCSGKYGISIHHEHYQGIEFEFELGCNKTEHIVKQLQSKSTTDTCYTAKMKLFVKDYSTGTPISGATVKIYLNDELVAEGETNSDGYYIKEQLQAPATYTVVISKDGYASKTFTINYKECTLLQETIKLQSE